MARYTWAVFSAKPTQKTIFATKTRARLQKAFSSFEAAVQFWNYRRTWFIHKVFKWRKNNRKFIPYPQDDGQSTIVFPRNHAKPLLQRRLRELAESTSNHES